MKNADYSPLEKIVADTVETKKINLGLFRQDMEKEFVQLGFREPPARGGVQNILIIRLDAVGDYILTSAAIRTIRENFPLAHITLVVSKNLYPLAELCPYVNEVFAIEQNQPFSAEMLYNVTNFAKEYLWRRRYDISFYLGIVYRPIRNFLSYLSGARERISFDVDEFSKFFHTKCIKILPQYYAHDCLMNLHLLNNVGLKVRDTRLEVWYDKTDLIAATNLIGNFAEGRIKIAVGIGANHKERKYPVEKYLVAFKEIISKGASLIILGGSSEVDDAKFLEDNLPKEFVKNLVPVQTGWRVDTAIINLCDIYIGNMTGACDISATLKKPIVALSRVAKEMKGLTEAISYRPWQTKSIILQPEHQLDECHNKPSFNGCRAGKSHCIAQIEPSEIVNAFEKILGRE